jgi:imidazolonepropionase-like amidohydrolase
VASFPDGNTVTASLMLCVLALLPTVGGKEPAIGAPDTLVIRDVTILPMDGPRLLTHQTVTIIDGRIVSIKSTDAAPNAHEARVIDGRGEYLLPGLADMHVHLTTADELPMFVGNGVLTVRDLNGSPMTLGWRQATAAGTLTGPRLFVSGPMIAGPEIPWKNKVTPSTAAEAEAVVVSQKRAGYDQIKIYDGISREVFESAIATAKREGMLSSGHIPASVGFDGVLESGMTGLEHLDKTVFAVMDHHLDMLRIPWIVDRIKGSGMWVTPTLESMIQLSAIGTGGYDSLMSRPEALAAPQDLRDFWTSVTSTLKANRPLAPGSKYDRWCDYQMRLAGALARAGVPMLAGTDLPNAVLVPGSSLLDELDALVEAGLTRQQAIDAATSAPARFFQQTADWGAVAVGRRADLLLLDGNPLDDLRTLRAPAGVVLGGRWLDRTTLQKLRTTGSPARPPE